MMWPKKTVEVELLEPEVLPKQELRRRAIVPSEPKSDLHQLALKAHTVLGYSILANYVGGPGPLAYQLHHLHIPVFNAAEVNRYQEYMVRQLNKKLPSDRIGGWATRSLRYYQEPVPEFVLRKAIQIAERLPKVEFIVEYLVVGFKSADPFLRVEYREKELNELYYIEVWDEPEFEAKL